MNRKNTFDAIYKNIDSKITKTFPNTIDIELTNHCNLDCSMCSRQLMTRKKGYMTRDTFNKIMEQCENRDVGIRFIRWGEPFLHPHLPDFCKQVKDTGHPLHITTNGLVMSETHMRGLVDMEVDSIIFSMQGLTKAEYTATRNTSLYDILKLNIKLLHTIRGDREKPYMTVTTTYTPLTGNGNINEFKEQWLEYVDDVQVGITNMARLTDEKPEGLEYIKCKNPYHKLGIDWDGKVTACCGDYDNLLTIGNVNDNSIFWIWNNSKRLRCIRNILDDDDNRMLTLCNKCYPAYGNFSNNTSKKE